MIKNKELKNHKQTSKEQFLFVSNNNNNNNNETGEILKFRSFFGPADED